MVQLYHAVARNVKSLFITPYIVAKNIDAQGHFYATESDAVEMKKLYPEKIFAKGDEGFKDPVIQLSPEQELEEVKQKLKVLEDTLASKNDEIVSLNSQNVQLKKENTDLRLQLDKDATPNSEVTNESANAEGSGAATTTEESNTGSELTGGETGSSSGKTKKKS